MSVVRQLGWEKESFPLALAGGIFQESEEYQRRVIAELTRMGAAPSPVTVVREPAEGAVQLALRQPLA
jgi:hypothetical protein